MPELKDGVSWRGLGQAAVLKHYHAAAGNQRRCPLFVPVLLRSAVGCFRDCGHQHRSDLSTVVVKNRSDLSNFCLIFF